MKLWGALYGTIWLLFVAIWLSLTPIGGEVPVYLHIVLGIAIVGVTYLNSEHVRDTRVPGRVKRIARSTFELSIVITGLGALLYFRVGEGWGLFAGITTLGLFTFLHFVVAIAMITQSAATAIAYDMWEEREFERESAPGEVPPPPSPARRARARTHGETAPRP